MVMMKEEKGLDVQNGRKNEKDGGKEERMTMKRVKRENEGTGVEVGYGRFGREEVIGGDDDDDPEVWKKASLV
ncbi:hypothetical protein LR48_Vigan252s004200 [Vigna angularis]|uniref:Uncharacterized protein n=1 Tax=Phaseolus angularis TaxID=3914 RepID=A0A0L9T6V0_PHAAN|nr:hypothetical protein LR48_Vigan252s004200 [Vigna angularis]